MLSEAEIRAYIQAVMNDIDKELLGTIKELQDKRIELMKYHHIFDELEEVTKHGNKSLE